MKNDLISAIWLRRVAQYSVHSRLRVAADEALISSRPKRGHHWHGQFPDSNDRVWHVGPSSPAGGGYPIFCAAEGHLHFLPTCFNDRLRITEDDKQAACAGQTDVETFCCPLRAAKSIDAEDNNGAFQALEAENIAVELRLIAMEFLPVLGNRIVFEVLLVNGMPLCGGEQCYLVVGPPLVDKGIQTIAGDI